MQRFFLIVMIGLNAILAGAQSYPQQYFRNPLDIPMKLVANFGEIRPNHWHMGLDIRTQQKVNLPVHAAAEGYIARVSIEPGGFGQAIYINHPNGYTTLYAHLNAFFPALAQYIQSKQYEQQSWQINLTLPPSMFPVAKGDFIAWSGSTGASQGPHLHFEIRDTKTEKCLNPLLFGFPVADDIPPTIFRVAMYDRNKSTYLQSPQMIGTGATIKVGTDKLSFAVGAVDRLNSSGNSNGIYGARVLMDGVPVSGFVLNNIGYDETRYINAQLDYRLKVSGGAALQHLTPLPGAKSSVYNFTNGDGVIYLKETQVHRIMIEVSDAAGNTSRRSFAVQYDPPMATALPAAGERWAPNNINIFERDNFELYTTEFSIYDTVNVSYAVSDKYEAGAVSPQYSFLSAAIPSHDSVTVRIKSSGLLSPEQREHVLIKNTCGTKSVVQKANWQNGWLWAKFRQFGLFQAFADTEPPALNAPPARLSGHGVISFTPRDHFNAIKSFRAELDGKWLRFSNNGGHTWVYQVDEHFPPGVHDLKVTVEDEAGNITIRNWKVKK